MPATYHKYLEELCLPIEMPSTLYFLPKLICGHQLPLVNNNLFQLLGIIADPGNYEKNTFILLTPSPADIQWVSLVVVIRDCLILQNNGTSSPNLNDLYDRVLTIAESSVAVLESIITAKYQIQSNLDAQLDTTSLLEYPQLEIPHPVLTSSKPKSSTPVLQCPLCNGPMTPRSGKFGTFFGCSNYPVCQGNRNPDGSLSKKMMRLALKAKSINQGQPIEVTPPGIEIKRCRKMGLSILQGKK